MNVCAFIVGLGLTILCPEPPPPPDAAAIELQKMREDMARADREADEKLDYFHGRTKAVPESLRQ
jgi:hypothetical protein